MSTCCINKQNVIYLLLASDGRKLSPELYVFSSPFNDDLKVLGIKKSE